MEVWRSLDGEVEEGGDVALRWVWVDVCKHGKPRDFKNFGEWAEPSFYNERSNWGEGGPITDCICICTLVHHFWTESKEA